MHTTTSNRDPVASLRMIGLKPSIRKIERNKRGLEVLSRLPYITHKADLPISKFKLLRNALHQGQLTMLADCHERAEAISSRLNDFFSVVETQIRGLRTYVDTTVSYGDPEQSKLKVFCGPTKRQLAQNVVKNAFEDLEKTLKKQFGIIKKDIINTLTELLKDDLHTSQRLATQGTAHGFTYQAFRRVFEAVRKQTLTEVEEARGWTFMLDEHRLFLVSYFQSAI